MPRAPQPTRYTITTDAARFDVDRVWRWLRGTDWAAGIPRAVVERSIRGALCFGIFEGDQQLGIARVITDRATFAYLADVYVDDSARKRGLAKRLLSAIIDHRELRGLRRWMLATRDAHGLYAKFGFRAIAHPQWFMEIHRPGLYRRRARARA
jgi:GNAT superfamily N-acetyltransferase